MSQSSWLDFKTLGIGTVCLFCEYKNKTDEKRRHKKLFFFIFCSRFLTLGQRSILPFPPSMRAPKGVRSYIGTVVAVFVVIVVPIASVADVGVVDVVAAFLRRGWNRDIESRRRDTGGTLPNVLGG